MCTFCLILQHMVQTQMTSSYSQYAQNGDAANPNKVGLNVVGEPKEGPPYTPPSLGSSAVEQQTVRLFQVSICAHLTICFQGLHL